MTFISQHGNLIEAITIYIFLFVFCMIDEPETIGRNVDQQIGTLTMVLPYVNGSPSNPGASWIFGKKDKQKDEDYFVANILNEDDENRFRIIGSKGASVLPSNHPCAKFTFPPPPPPNLRRIGPRRKFQSILLVLIISVALNIEIWHLDVFC